MDTLLVALLAIACGAAAGLLLARHAHAPVAPAAAPEVLALRDELRSLGDRVASDTSVLTQRLEGIDTRMSRTQATMSATSTAGQDMVGKVFAALGDLSTATKTVADQAREFSALQDMLKAPKARGALGEAMLEELLRQVLPPQGFATQHGFKSGVVVDAVVKAGGKLVCIDSKFPLANYRRMCAAGNEPERRAGESAFAADVDRHIRDIARRYIVPDEGTFDFAVMYVPAEGLYGEILRLSHNKRPLFEVAIDARVVPMSPLSLYGYLQTILLGLKCLRIEEGAQKILDYTGRLQSDMDRFVGEYDTLGRHLNNARGKYEEGTKRLDRFRDKLERVIDFADDDEPLPTLEVVND